MPHVVPPHEPSAGPLGGLARVSFRRRGVVVVGWLALLALAFGLSSVASGDFTADYAAKDSGSQRAKDVLAQQFPGSSGATVDVVVRAERGVAGRAVRAEVGGLLGKLAHQPHVAGVDDPYASPGGISPDGKTLVAHLRLDVTNPIDMPVTQSRALVSMAQDAERPGLRVALGGTTIGEAERSGIGSEGVGIAAAGIILLLTFGSVVAAGLPISVAVAGLAVSTALTGVATAAVDVPDWATSVATMIGLGIGIDYALLMLTRFREWRAVGLEVEAATVATMDTAGRSVVLAGVTVVISMLGLFAMGLSYMRGVAVVTIIAVLVVMGAALTLFPALLGYFGRHVDRLRLPLGRARPVSIEGAHVVPSPTWVRWSRLVDRHSVIASILGVGLLVALALPFLGLRFGFQDAGNNQKTTSTRQAYDMLARGFGDGANGPLLLTVSGASAAKVKALGTALRTTKGVVSVTPPQLNPKGSAALLTVTPRDGPQSEATNTLVRQIREDLIPTALAGSGAQAFVGGTTATYIDSTDAVTSRIPWLITGVVTLSMLLLLMAFRSVLIPVTAAVMNLLSVGAAYGVIGLVSQGGWAGQLIGIDTETPLPAFLPVLMFAILFGLSMDYEVFLISRMRESWISHGDPGRAIVDGLAGTGRVITAAAAIMVAVFGAFVPSSDLNLKVVGIGMASAILIDATIVRMLLVPAVMHLLGRANWWLPTWLDRLLPQWHIEGQPEKYLPRKTPASSDQSVSVNIYAESCATCAALAMAYPGGR
jgi:RND superfamily putative drug exporter